MRIAPASHAILPRLARRRLLVGLASVTAGLVLLAGCGGTGHRAGLGNGTRPATASHAKNSGSRGAAPGTSTTSTTMTPPAPATSTTVPAQTQTAGSPLAIAASSLVATIRPSGVPGSQSPGGPATLEVPGSWWGAPSALPVLNQAGDWLEVRLAQRPNESTAWVPAADVTLATDTYHIVVNLVTTHLQLFNNGQPVASFPAGVGVPSDPTPPGNFFVAFFARAPSPGYGQFLMVTSAHSDAISDWEMSGDAITAIHGSLDADAAIGTTGAQVSHGCIRLHNSDLSQLRDVPPGTPVDIVA